MNQSPNLNRSWEESQQIIKSLEAEITQLKAQQEAKECRCHIIDPAKMRILLWINRHKNGKPDTCVLKIAEQRLLGLPRSDRRGETYWRFDEIIETKKEPQTSFKCSECKEEVLVVGSDNPAEEIRQRAALKKELAQMESKSETNKAQANKAQAELQELQEKAELKAKEKAELKAKEPNPRQELKAQIAQAIKENQAEQNQQEKLEPKNPVSNENAAP